MTEEIYKNEPTDGCEIAEYSEEGFRALVTYGSWRVAIINFAERLRKENFTRIERHLETDEVFILVEGSAVLVVGSECRRIPMEKGKVYNIKKCSWHHILMDPPDPATKVIVVENADTSAENTEYRYLGDL